MFVGNATPSDAIYHCGYTADTGVSTVFVMPVSGGPWQVITAGRAHDDRPHWAPDGRTIYFASNRGGLLNVWGRRVDQAAGTSAGTPFQVTSFQSPRQTLATQLSLMQLAVTNDRLFLSLTDRSGELWMLEELDRQDRALTLSGIANRAETAKDAARDDR